MVTKQVRWVGLCNHMLQIDNNYVYISGFFGWRGAALVKYIITMSKLFHGLTKMQTKQLAYKFAKNKNIKIPQNWICDEAAGEDWLKGFRKAKAGITLRQP